jgi:protoporphyrinogen oxidase
MPDDELKHLGLQEMRHLKLAEPQDHLDSVVIRMPKAYPGYFGTYGSFDELRKYLDSLPNLFLVGRNGMHRYNNQDHSMLSAKRAADAIVSGNRDKSGIWNVNIDDEYHEEASSSR